MLCVYPPDSTDFSSNGLGTIAPSSALVKETLKRGTVLRFSPEGRQYAAFGRKGRPVWDRPHHAARHRSTGLFPGRRRRARRSFRGDGQQPRQILKRRTVPRFIANKPGW